MHQYKVCGIRIASEIEIPAWTIEQEGVPEVSIVLGAVDMPGHSINQYQISKSGFHFWSEDIGKFSVENGRRITVDPVPEADIESVRVYLTGGLMGVLFIQREIVAVHGACIALDGAGVIITGEKGAGKSTLSSALRRAGCGFLSDDVAVVTFQAENQPLVHPAFARQRLLKDAAELLGYDLNAVPMSCRADDKYIVDAKDVFQTVPIPLRAIIELRVGEREAVVCHKITGVDKIERMRDNIYSIRPYLTCRIGLNPSYVQQYINIVKIVPFYNLLRPPGQYSLAEQIQWVRKIVAGEI
ncbi:MAG: hypothetical protein LBT32_09370 [Peptococcaceae bacterium]|jgi:hypothetical protein|nr:hypothetical protein [Peptococcaceae bacterium]